MVFVRGNFFYRKIFFYKKNADQVHIPIVIGF